MDLTIRKVLALLIPTSILSLTFFWWKQKNKSLQTNEHKEDVTNLGKDSLSDAGHQVVTEEIIKEKTEQEQFQSLKMECDKFFEDQFDDVLTVDDSTGIKASSRKRQQSSCDCDSAYVEDYSSDGVSMSGSDSTINKSSEQVSIDPVFEEVPPSDFILIEELESENCKCRDWYTNALEPSSEYKVLHWGSQPVSDIEGDDHTLKSDFVGGVAIEKLSIVLNNQYNEQKKRLKSLKSPRRKNKEKIPTSKPHLQSSTKKSSKSPKKIESPRKPTRSKKQQVEKKDIDKPWREQSQILPRSDQYIVREYEIEEDLCGKIIGRHGKSVKEIHDSTGATVCIECEKLGAKRVVSIAGLLSQVQKAEKLLLSRFKNAMKKVGDELFIELKMSLEFTSLQCEACFDVIVTAIINAGNLFVQIFDDDVDEKLVNLQNDLANKYMQAPQKLMYSNEMKPKVDDICIGFIDNTWCRVKVVEYTDADQIVISFLDYGGVAAIPWQMVFRIR